MRLVAALFAGLLLCLATPRALRSQAPPAKLDWSVDDSAHIAFVTAHGHPRVRTHAIVWAPDDSLEGQWLDRFSDSLDQGIASLKALVGGPHGWQRLGNGPVVYYLSPGRFISHASGRGAVFISLERVRRRSAPFLHEAVHELLLPRALFFPFEHPDSLVEARVAAGFPYWLSEGFADYLAKVTAERTRFPEGDIFEVGPLATVDSVCAARLSTSPRSAEILQRIGRQGRLEALFTEERATVVVAYYTCSQAFTRYLVDRIGVPATVALYPGIPSGTWEESLTGAAGRPLAVLRRDWLQSIGRPE